MNDNKPSVQGNDQENSQSNNQASIKLTAYSHGAGCGCKISPAVLDGILPKGDGGFKDARLLVGNELRDDAAVWQIDKEQSLISTTDFFMPIVDDPYDFGRVAATNAISDVYAMGGNPVLALAILGWPVNLIPIEHAGRIMEGARSVCMEAGISLAGGHSIDTPEPIFGLAVNGLVKTKYLKRNATATAGCKLYLTKPLGVGILSTAQKKGLLKPAHARLALENMTLLNKAGAVFGTLDYVTAMTDVTGFGLLGHLRELCKGANLNAEIEFDKVPLLEGVLDYLNQGAIPGGTERNWKSYGADIAEISEKQRQLLADPQTSGGLLVAVNEDKSADFEEVLRGEGLSVYAIGRLIVRDVNATGTYIQVV